MARAHLGRGGALSRALRVRGVEHGSMTRSSVAAGLAAVGGERRELNDPISLKIVGAVDEYIPYRVRHGAVCGSRSARRICSCARRRRRV